MSFRKRTPVLAFASEARSVLDSARMYCMPTVEAQVLYPELAILFESKTPVAALAALIAGWPAKRPLCHGPFHRGRNCWSGRTT
jgi:hypothetical protein